MIKTKADLTNHLKTLIETGELSFITFCEWLAYGDLEELYVELRVKQFEQELESAEDKDFYLSCLFKQFLYDSARLNISSLHAINEFHTLTLKAQSLFLRKCKGFRVEVAQQIS